MNEQEKEELRQDIAKIMSTTLPDADWYNLCWKLENAVADYIEQNYCKKPNINRPD